MKYLLVKDDNHKQGMRKKTEDDTKFFFVKSHRTKATNKEIALTQLSNLFACLTAENFRKRLLVNYAFVFFICLFYFPFFL